MLNILKNTINRVFASGVDSDASAFITATGLSGTTQKSAITTLVKDLKSSGLWSKMKAVYPMVTDNRNSLYYTEDYSNALWYKTNGTITTNSIAAPDGTLTADTLTDNATNALHFVSTSVSPVGQNGNNTCSIYAKANTLNWISVFVYDGTTAYFTYFNLSNGTIGTNAAGNTASIVDAGNGWYRCIVTRNYNATAGGAGCGFTTANADGVNSYVGTGKSIHLWGAQFETGSTVSTYQPIATTASAFMASQMKYNLKDARDLDAAFRLTWSGGWTYSATGATPNGTNAYADTKLVPSTAIASVNSNSLGYYSGSNLAETSSDPVNMGSTISGTQAINILKSNTNISSRLNGDVLTYATAIMKGFFVATRPSSTVANLFFNGSKVSTITPNGTLPIYSVLIGTTAFGSSPYAQGYVKNDFRFAFIADGLNDTDSLLLNQITEKYQVALSRGVQAAQSFYYNSTYSNEANTYLYSTQITGTTQVSAINTLINGLKANNLWSKMKAVYPFVTDKTLQSDMAAQMKFNLVNPQDSDAAFRLAFSGGWTYSTNGAQPNGVNGFAYTSLVPDNNGLTVNNNSLSFYSRTSAANGATQYYEMGSGDTAGLNQISLYTRRSTDIAAYDTGAFATNRNSYTNTDGSGYYIGKINSDLTSKVFKNGVLKGTKTITNQALLSAYQIYLGGFNENNTTVYFSPKQMAFAHIGTGLSDAEVAILNQLITDYQTTLSRQV